MQARLDQRQRTRRQQRRSDALQRSRSDQPDRCSVASPHSTDATVNQMTPSRNDLPASEPVAQRAAEQHERGQRQQVGVNRPLQAPERRVQVLADVRQRDVDDGAVEDRKRRTEDGAEQQTLAPAIDLSAISTRLTLRAGASLSASPTGSRRRSAGPGTAPRRTPPGRARRRPPTRRRRATPARRSG